MVSLELLHKLLDLPEDVLISTVNQTPRDHVRNMFSVFVVGNKDCDCLPSSAEGEDAMIVTSSNLHDPDSWWRR